MNFTHRIKPENELFTDTENPIAEVTYIQSESNEILTDEIIYIVIHGCLKSMYINTRERLGNLCNGRSGK